MNSESVLVVEDRASLRRMMRTALAQAGYAVTVAAEGDQGLELAGTGRFALVLTDLRLPGASGLEILGASRAVRPEVPVIVLTAHGTVQVAVDAMKAGAADFLEKPIDVDDLLRLVESHLSRRTASRVLEAPGSPEIVGRHPLLRAAARLAERVAATDSTVLLTGESGTGKELFARAIHALSPRRKGPFVAVNCAALPEPLLENELFGHEKGAFTGAHKRHAGRFETARGGTILLDEIGELGPSVQAKVLRVLEEGRFERVGGSSTVSADARIVAATNRDLREMVDAGEFRADLYFRLEVFPIELPPLRERASDIPVIADHVLGRLAKRMGRRPPRLSRDALGFLEAEPWPGNVRQLANLLERAVILAEEPAEIGAAELRALVGGGGAEPQAEPQAEPRGDPDREAGLRRALEASGGDKKEAARLLGIGYRTLLRRVKEFDLEGYPRYRS